MFNLVSGQGKLKFQPQEYIEYFEDCNFYLTPRWGKGGIVTLSHWTRIRKPPDLCHATHYENGICPTEPETVGHGRRDVLFTGHIRYVV